MATSAALRAPRSALRAGLMIHVPATIARACEPKLPTILGTKVATGLVVAAIVAIRDAGLPQPGCGWCISPWVDMEVTGETMVSKATVDTTVQKAGILDMARLYLNAADPRSPLAAPIYADNRSRASLDPGRRRGDPARGRDPPREGGGRASRPGAEPARRLILAVAGASAGSEPRRGARMLALELAESGAELTAIMAATMSGPALATGSSANVP